MKALAVTHHSVQSATWPEIKEQALTALKSGLLPKAIDTPEKALVIAMTGRELGIGVMQSLTGLYVVNGMVGMKGNLMLRLIYERVPGAVIRITTPTEKSNQECTVEMARPGQRVQSFRFTLQDAQKAGYMNKATWQQHTATMLRWAAIRIGARVVFADALAGCYMHDEIPGKATNQEEDTEEPAIIEAEVKVEPSALPPPEPPTSGSGSALVEFKSDKGIDLGETVLTAGIFKGKKLKERTPQEWLTYIGTVKKHLNAEDPEFSAEARIQAEDVIDTIEVYLSTL